MVSEAGQFGGALDEGDAHPNVMITPTAIQNPTRMPVSLPTDLYGLPVDSAAGSSSAPAPPTCLRRTAPELPFNRETAMLTSKTRIICFA
jgi:hypothetical protein